MNELHETKPASRRERLRENAREEIKALARQQMAASGTASITLNVIARAMGVVPSALYRYYADRDALITALIVDAYASLAETLLTATETIADQQYGNRLQAAAEAYRIWALAHPVDFQLIFGNPIPEYHAPIELTGPASMRVFGVFLQTLQAAYLAGKLQPWVGYHPEAFTAHKLNGSGQYAPAAMYAGIMGWSKMHGMVTLELFGHLSHAIANPAIFFRSEMQSYLDTIGLPFETN